MKEREAFVTVEHSVLLVFNWETIYLVFFFFAKSIMDIKLKTI